MQRHETERGNEEWGGREGERKRDVDREKERERWSMLSQRKKNETKNLKPFSHQAFPQHVLSFASVAFIWR